MVFSPRKSPDTTYIGFYLTIDSKKTASACMYVALIFGEMPLSVALFSKRFSLVERLRRKKKLTLLGSCSFLYLNLIQPLWSPISNLGKKLKTCSNG